MCAEKSLVVSLNLVYNHICATVGRIMGRIVREFLDSNKASEPLRLRGFSLGEKLSSRNDLDAVSLKHRSWIPLRQGSHLPSHLSRCPSGAKPLDGSLNLK